MFQSINKRAEILIPSVKNCIIGKVTHFCTFRKVKQIIEILNIRRPRTEPWGTLCVNSSHELNAELIFVL